MRVFVMERHDNTIKWNINNAITIRKIRVQTIIQRFDTTCKYKNYRELVKVANIKNQ